MTPGSKLSAKVPTGTARGVLYVLTSAALLAGGSGGSPPPAPVTPVEVEQPKPAPAPPKLLEEEMPDTIVYAALKTSAQAIKPGSKFLIAVHFDITEGYRISWSNPGDVGKGTHVEFEVPEGFEVGPLMFPAPTRFELPGDLIGYGYEGETAVFAEVKVPKQIKQNKAYRFEAKARWVACKRDCGNEEISAYFELVAMHDAPKPQLPEELRPIYAALPKSFEELPTAYHEWKGTPGEPALTLGAEKVKWVDFFLADVEAWKLVKVDSSEEGLNLRFEGSAARPLRGLAVADIDGKHAYYDVNLPWPDPDARPAGRATASRRATRKR
jgi:hypothetical protein